MPPAAHAGQLPSSNSEELCSDLNQVVARAEAAISEVVATDVSVQFALSPNVGRVAVRSADLQQLVVALCSEAGSTLAGGRLVIETRGMNDAQLGPMSLGTDMQARVIVRAERPHQAPTPNLPRKALRSETRLGFSALQTMVDRLGGRLEPVPSADGALSYVVHLPYVLPGSSSGRMPVAAAQGLEVILLVEDEPQVQAVTARILRAFGYSVITAHNERTALAQAEQHGAAISLIVSDLVLPGVSGTELVRRLRQPCERARVLYMSGYTPEHLGGLVQEESFLRKPFTADELVTMVRDLLASALH